MKGQTALLFPFLLLLITGQQWDDRPQHQNYQIRVTKEVQDVVVEEFETSVITLLDYISGSLLNLKHDITLLNPDQEKGNIKEVLQVAEQSITMLPQTDYLSYEYMPNSDLTGPYETFTRSTIFMDNGSGILKMYMVDRSFNFVSFSFENYLQNKIENRTWRRLDNSTIDGGTCSDLKHVQMNKTNQFLILFCLKSQKINAEEFSARKTYLTIIQIRNFQENDPVILYYTQNYDLFPIDFTIPVRFVANFTNVTFYNTNYTNQTVEGSFGLFLVKLLDEPPELRNMPRFVWFNFTVFDEMYMQQQHTKFVEGPELNLMIRASSLYLRDHVNTVRIIDQKTIFRPSQSVGYLTNSTNLNLAIIMSAQGLMLCEIEDYKKLIQRNHTIYCNDSENAFIQLDSSALSVFFDPANPDERLYLISASPPQVFEFDIQDYRNTMLTRIYVSQPVANRQFIALPQMTANLNQVMLLMKDIFTGENVIRIFARNSSFFRTVQNDIYLPELSRNSFFFFPNYYFNKFIFRDEMTVNITLSNPLKLIFDRSESQMNYLGQQSQLLNNKIFNISIYHQDNYGRINITDFIVTFVDRYNLQIFQTSQEKIDRSGGTVNLFYNCGDKNFLYNFDKLFNGPEFKIRYETTSNESLNYFNFAEAREEFKSVSLFNNSHCQKSLLIPIITSNKAEIRRMLMVCISFKQAHFTSYAFDADQYYINFSETEIQKEIDMPFQKILMYDYDYANKVLIAILSFENNLIDNQQSDIIEVHFISMSETMNWRAKKSMNVSQFIQKEDTSELIDIFTYSSYYTQGIIIQNNLVTYDSGIQINNATMMIFQVDYLNFEFAGQQFFYNVSVMGNLTRAQITTESLFLCLTDQGYIYVMQIFPEVIKSVGMRMSLNQTRKIIDFDIFEQFYLVLYHDDGVTEVYTLHDNIETSFRMRLPLYKKYENYKYKLFQDTNLPNQFKKVPKKDYFEKSLAILMEDPLTKDAIYMIYKLDEQQHNSLYVSNASFSSLLYNSVNTQIMLTGDREELNIHYLGIVSDYIFSIVKIQYFDLIEVNEQKNFQLIERCKNIIEDKLQYEYYPKSETIQQISIQPYTDLVQYQKSQMNSPQNISINIKSSNLGIAIVPQSGEIQHIYFSDEMVTWDLSQIENDQIKGLKMMMGKYLQGYNMEYQVECQFNDYKGIKQNCSNNLSYSIQTQLFNFPINFATSNTKVLYGFPLERFIMLIDNQDSIRIQKIQDDYDSNNIIWEPLQNIVDWNQQKTLGCKIESDAQFAKVFQVNHTQIKGNPQAYQDRELFLFLYQCKSIKDMYRKLMAIEIAVFKEGQCPQNLRGESDQCIITTPINDGIDIQYDIIDLGLANFTFFIPENYNTSTRDEFNITSQLSYDAQLAVVCGIQTSYSNLLLIYNFRINGSNPEFNKTYSNKTLLKFNSASKLQFDTFKVNSVQVVPFSKFIVATIEGFGAILYHTGTNQIIYKINITEPDAVFGLYDQQLYGEINIFIVSVLYPYNIFVMTDMGVFAYGFEISLSKETEILKNPDLYTPKLIRLQRFPFPISSVKEVTTYYGISLLIQSPVGRGAYATYLTVISQYQNLQSKLFKTIEIDESGYSQNLNCSSFSRNQRLEITEEDQLGVSMICNQRLRAARFCLSPSIDVNLYTYPAINQDLDKGAVAFNYFNIKLTARNDFSYQNVNEVSVNVTLSYSLIPYQRLGILTFILIALIVLFAMILFLFLRSRQSKYDREQDLLRQHKKYIRQEQENHQRKESFLALKSRSDYQNSTQYKKIDLSQIVISNKQSKRNSKQQAVEAPLPSSNKIRPSKAQIIDTDVSFSKGIMNNTIAQLFRPSDGQSDEHAQSMRLKISSAQFGDDKKEEKMRVSVNIQDDEQSFMQGTIDDPEGSETYTMH